MKESFSMNPAINGKFCSVVFQIQKRFVILLIKY